MEELVKKITEKTGITPEQAKATIETIVEYVKDKIPPMFHGQIDKIMESHK
jgi:nucleoid DNA-binding protein